MISSLLLVVFLLCGLVYSRANKELVRLNAMRMEHEHPEAAKIIPGFVQKMGLSLSGGGEELKSYCARHGLSDRFDRANNQMLAAIAVALVCAGAILWLGKPKQ